MAAPRHAIATLLIAPVTKRFVCDEWEQVAAVRVRRGNNRQRVTRSPPRPFLTGYAFTSST